MFSRKVFVFTDDLDVTNRLFHNLLDAEGRRGDGREHPYKQPLASLRASARPRAADRFREGQHWGICEFVGHRLSQVPERLRVGRTSSQDAGVDAAAEVIVATASLEVGYDDRYVGAVIQHKAPRDAAAFLQRKGRAGRQRVTRPWTVAVLSDYGRDRLAYQAYERLFDPVIENPILPVGNRYVLRIHAVYAFMDWMASQCPSALPRGSVWQDFTSPARQPESAERQAWAAQFIRDLLEQPEHRKPLEDHLARALRISSSEVTALLWEPPRDLM
jgi:hypothetical protein